MDDQEFLWQMFTVEEAINYSMTDTMNIHMKNGYCLTLNQTDVRDWRNFPKGSTLLACFVKNKDKLNSDWSLGAVAIVKKLDSNNFPTELGYIQQASHALWNYRYRWPKLGDQICDFRQEDASVNCDRKECPICTKGNA